MTEEQVQEKMIDRVQKLLRKAESTTPEEAEALMQKAEQLMAQHAISEAMLAEGGKLDDEIIMRRIDMKGSYHLGLSALGFAVGRGYGFRLMQSKRSNATGVIWIGWKRDVDKAEVILTSLLIQQERAAREYMKRTGEGFEFMTAFEKFNAKRSFMVGFADGVEEKLIAARNVAKKDYAKETGTTSSSMELVLVSRSEQLDKYYDKIPKGKARASRTSYDGSAAGQGRVAGRNADTGGTGVGGGTRGSIGR
jgi:hypothetical protein